MGYMFSDCINLTELNLSNFDMTYVTNTNFMFSSCSSLHTLRLDNCSNNTINKIITSYNFPTGLINGETRKIYCRQANAAGLTAPDGWKFVFVD
jgi:surface protein